MLGEVDLGRKTWSRVMEIRTVRVQNWIFKWDSLGKCYWFKYTNFPLNVVLNLDFLTSCTGGRDSSCVPWSKVLRSKRHTKALLFMLGCLICWLKRGIKRRNILRHHVADVTEPKFRLPVRPKSWSVFVNVPCVLRKKCVLSISWRYIHIHTHMHIRVPRYPQVPKSMDALKSLI